MIKKKKKTKNKSKLKILKRAKDFDERELAGCGLVALVIKVPVAACK